MQYKTFNSYNQALKFATENKIGFTDNFRFAIGLIIYKSLYQYQMSK